MFGEDISAPDYDEAAFIPEVRAFLVRKIVQVIKKEFPQTKAIAGRGNSGIPLASIVSYKMNLPMIAARRDRHEGHDNRATNGYIGDGDYIIVDDLIASGHTVSQIVNAAREAGCKGKCGGIILYGGGSDRHSHRFADGNTVEVISVEREVTSYTHRLKRDHSHRLTRDILKRATHVWKTHGRIHARTRNGESYLGDLYVSRCLDEQSIREHWIDRLLDSGYTGPIVLVTDDNLLVLPYVTKHRLRELCNQHKEVAYIQSWSRCQENFRKCNGCVLYSQCTIPMQLENKTKLRTLKGLSLMPPDLQSIPAPEPVVEGEVEPEETPPTVEVIGSYKASPIVREVEPEKTIKIPWIGSNEAQNTIDEIYAKAQAILDKNTPYVGEKKPLGRAAEFLKRLDEGLSSGKFLVTIPKEFYDFPRTTTIATIMCKEEPSAAPPPPAPTPRDSNLGSGPGPPAET